MIDKDPVDSRKILIAQHGHPKQPDSPSFYHLCEPGEYIAYYLDGSYKKLKEKKEGEDYPQEVLFTEANLQSLDLVIGFEDSLNLAIVEHPGKHSIHFTQSPRHTTLFRGGKRFEIIRGHEVSDLLEAEHEFEKNPWQLPEPLKN